MVECRFSALLPMLEKESLTDQQADDALLASRVDPKTKKPSVEAVFHAWLLSLPGIKFVGHTHATTVNQILCSPRARENSPFNAPGTNSGSPRAMRAP